MKGGDVLGYLTGGQRWLLIWFGLAWIFGFFTSWLAQERGRKDGIWFILGFLFWFIALLAVGLAPTRENTTALTPEDAASSRRDVPIT